MMTVRPVQLGCGRQGLSVSVALAALIAVAAWAALGPLTERSLADTPNNPLQLQSLTDTTAAFT
ncbi:MAG: hypothetical protein F4Y11_05115 [Chloroflexi bacterium]|nr:hypothetical protein [Chloroflexota bacterium]